jgi:competence ComEA-like helix-hairpin-helix protein
VLIRLSLGILFSVSLLPLLCSCAKLPRREFPASRESSPLADVNGILAKRININTASASQLEELPGVGKVLAERIVAHREQYGPFRRAEHLMMVRGFSDNKFRKIRDLVTVE